MFKIRRIASSILWLVFLFLILTIAIALIEWAGGPGGAALAQPAPQIPAPPPPGPAGTEGTTASAPAPVPGQTAPGQATPATCGKCHQQQQETFAKSKHAIAWTPKMTDNPRYKVMDNFKAMQQVGCEQCHYIGQTWEDKSIGRCDSCHTRHKFSAAEARTPEACSTCHMGPDHAQLEYYETFKHGVIYRAEGESGRAPTCVTCHQPGGTHNVSLNLTLGQVANGAFIKGTRKPLYPQGSKTPLVPMREITREEFDKNRTGMIKICSNCHSEGFAKNYLKQADAIKDRADATTSEAAAIIAKLYDERLLNPRPKELVLGGGQLYSGTSLIESLFFKMIKFDHVHTWKGAYHENAEYTHWIGWSEMQRSLSAIKDQDAAVRFRANQARRTRQLAGWRELPAYWAWEAWGPSWCCAAGCIS